MQVQKSALITGVTGQDGYYLTSLLISKNYKVFGLVRTKSNPSAKRLLQKFPSLVLIEGDLTDSKSLLRALEQSKPDEVYNLGAFSFVGESWKKAKLMTEITAVGTLNLLESIRTFAGEQIEDIRFYQASSSEMFGLAAKSPQDETVAFWPRSPYGVAKVFSHHMTINYRESYGLHASSGILFNHESPLRGSQFVTKKITSSVAKISRGLQTELILGNLETQRDWGFAGDYVEAMWKMLQQDIASDYVIATGKVHSLRDFVRIAFEAVGISDWENYVRLDASLTRPADIQVLVGDATKARTILDWQPSLSFHELVNLMVEADLEELEF